MSYRLWAERLETADLAGSLRVAQKITPLHDAHVKSLHSRFVFHGRPDLTGLRLSIHEMNGDGSIGHALSGGISSKAWTRNEVSSEDFAVKELWFEFDNPPFLQEGDSYFVVPSADSYAGDSDDHVAWVRAWPDPYAWVGFVPSWVNRGVAPFGLTWWAHEVK